jgi:hypothetical protein
MLIRIFTADFFGCEDEVVLLHAMDGAWEEWRYSSYSSLTSALEWSASRPGRALPPDKEPLAPIVQEAV